MELVGAMANRNSGSLRRDNVADSPFRSQELPALPESTHDDEADLHRHHGDGQSLHAGEEVHAEAAAIHATTHDEVLKLLQGCMRTYSTVRNVAQAAV